MGSAFAEGGNLPYTRGYAPRAPHAQSINFGTASRWRNLTAGSPSHAARTQTSNRGYAVHAGHIPNRNHGLASKVPAGARAIKVGEKSQNKKKGKKKKKKKNKENREE